MLTLPTNYLDYVANAWKIPVIVVGVTEDNLQSENKLGNSVW